MKYFYANSEGYVECDEFDAIIVGDYSHYIADMTEAKVYLRDNYVTCYFSCDDWLFDIICNIYDVKLLSVN